MERYEIILQPFSESLGDFWLEFPCSHCNEIVKATKKSQRELAFGGVGHKCNNCDTYYAFFRCPCCGQTTGFDDKEWELLTTPEGAKCPSCKASLYRKKETWRPTLMSIASYTPSLSQWSSSVDEKLYLGKIRQNCSSELQKSIALRHHSVGVRMKSAKKSLDYLIKEKWYSPFSLSNSPNQNIQQKMRTPFDHEFHENVFGFINNLRSALDMLAQEVASVCLHNYNEKDIEYKSIDQKLTTNNSSIATIISSFRGEKTYSYLNKLRNVLQHRRLPMMVTMGEFESVHLDSIRPVNVRSFATVHLPDNPYDEPDMIASANGLELFGFINRAYAEIENHIFAVYKQLHP